MTEEQLKALEQLQRSLWFVVNDNDPESTGPSVTDVTDILTNLIDILVGKPYKGPFVK